MVNSNFLKRLMVVGERNILQQLSDYTDLATEASSELSEMIRADDVSKAKKNLKIRDLERKADELSLRLKDQITGGAISSTLMETIIELVETCDDLLDGSYYISREIRRMHKNRHKFDDQTNSVIDHTYEISLEILQKFSEALLHVREIFNSHDFQMMKVEREKIQQIEESGDDLKDGIIDFIYDHSDTIPYIVFVHSVGLAHRLDDLLDDCEDISDLVHTINVAVTR
ncbi:MAG: DUF47 family protein [Thermoplasmataceae archaeon]|jgi:uncharacterized protein Yka (UPF0111/DUF47 family)